MMEAIDLVKAGKAPRSTQDDSQATYESWCKAEDVEIDWSKTAREVHNLVRGADPQPGAWTTLNGKRLQIYDSVKGPAAPGAGPGTVTAVGEAGLSVAASDGTLVVSRVRPVEGKKTAASDFAQEAGLAVGARVGN